MERAQVEAVTEARLRGELKRTAVQLRLFAETIASGAYLDTVTLTLTYGNNIDVPGTVPVAIYAPALCTLTTPPGNINLAYAAFGPQVSASTTLFGP